MRQDPYGSFNFLVEIDGLLVGGFSEVSGLSVETEVDAVPEGGINDFVHQIPKGTKYSDITLKRGVSDLDLIWGWYKNVINGKIERKDGSIILLDSKGGHAMRWNFFNAFPKKWDGPTLNASTSAVATETLVLAHEGLEKS